MPCCGPRSKAWPRPSRRPRPTPRGCAMPAPREVVVAGNLKFDIAPEAGADRARPALEGDARRRARACSRRSTREGEEASLLAAWRARGRAAAAARRRAAPSAALRRRRRADRRGRLRPVAAQRLGRTRRPRTRPRADVWLGDSMREMPAWYALADVALLGGSFAPLGGQNLIEAAACGCPVVMGPHTFNFADAAELALAAGAAIRVATIEEGVAAGAGARRRATSARQRERCAAWRSRRRIAAPPRAWPRRIAAAAGRRPAPRGCERSAAQQRQRPAPWRCRGRPRRRGCARRSAGDRRARPSAPRAGRW